MADIKISQLTGAAAASGTQEFEVNDSGTSKKVTGAQIKAFAKDGLVVADVTDLTATATELNYVDGVTSAIQTQLDAKLALAGGTLTGAAVGSTLVDPSNSGNITLDFSTYQNFVLTLTGNVTLDNPTTETVGQSGFIVLIQDATGGRTVSLGTDYETAGGAGITLSSAAFTTDIVPYIVAASGRILLGTPQLAFA